MLLGSADALKKKKKSHLLNIYPTRDFRKDNDEVSSDKVIYFNTYPDQASNNQNHNVCPIEPRISRT